MNVRFFDPGLTYTKHKKEILAEYDRVRSAGKLILQEDVEKFENKLAAFVGTKYAIGLNSGTDALYLAMKALGIGPGDEVITVSYTFVATIQTIAQTGATPVLVDVGNDHLMDIEALKRAITPRTKAIIPVHIEGMMVDMPRMIEQVTADHEIFVIEDAAQALGASINNRKAGAWGVMGCFSFYPAKILGSAGDAGAITTNDKALYEEIIKLRNHYLIGKKPTDPNETVKFGINSRLDNVHAAELNLHMDWLEEYLARRAAIAAMYNNELRNVPIRPPTEQGGRVWQDYVIRCDRRDELFLFLKEKGIETLGANEYPNHLRKGLKLDHFKLPTTEKMIGEFLRLPCNPNLTSEEVRYVIKMIYEFFAL